MTFTLAVTSGPGSAGDLAMRVGRPGAARAALRTHEDHAVAWAADSPWVSSHDDGDVLVVVDGGLHSPAAKEQSPAALLHERYRDVRDDLARDVLGDFVVAVLDRPRRSLLVCRDPVGARPWYQTRRGDRHAGATDVASLLSLPWVSEEVDEGSALAFLAGRSESRGPTLYKSVTTLRPGTTWRARAGSTSSWAHFTWRIEPEPQVSWDGAIDRCRQVLDDAVRCRIQALGATASELSGGLDSSSVVGTAALLGEELLVGRLLFDGRSADEREFSQAVIDHWSLEAVSAPPTILSAEESAALAAQLRRPPPDPNFTMFTGLLRALAAHGRTGVLTGLGGDDAFVDAGLENRMISAVQQRRRDVLGPVLRATLRDPRGQWRSAIRPTVRSLLPRSRRRPPAYIPPAVAERYGLTARYAEPVQRVTGVRGIDVRAGGLTTGHVAGGLEESALIEDLTGTRQSHPFLDPRVIEATYGLDPWFPVQGGHYRALQAAAYADRIPVSVAARLSKAEFSEVVWPVSLRPEVVRRIATGPLAARGWLDPVGLNHVLSDARVGRAHAALPLARMTALDQWLRLLHR